MTRCFKGDNCEYAHSEEELIAWNDQLRQIKKRARLCNDTVVLKKCKTSESEIVAVSSTVASTSSSSTSTSSHHHLQLRKRKLKPKTSVLERTVAVSSSPTSHCRFEFVETEIYRQLLETIKTEMTDDINNIQIFGPKGTGKTYALLRLKEILPDARYIDLADGSETVSDWLQLNA